MPSLSSKREACAPSAERLTERVRGTFDEAVEAVTQAGPKVLRSIRRHPESKPGGSSSSAGGAIFSQRQRWVSPLIPKW